MPRTELIAGDYRCQERFEAITAALAPTADARKQLESALLSYQAIWSAVEAAVAEYNQALVRKMMAALDEKDMWWCEGMNGHVAESRHVQTYQVIHASQSDYESPRRSHGGYRALCAACFSARGRSTGRGDSEALSLPKRPIRDHPQSYLQDRTSHQTFFATLQRDLGVSVLSVDTSKTELPQLKLVGWPQPR